MPEHDGVIDDGGERNEFDWAAPGLGPEVNHPYQQHEVLRCCVHCGGGKWHAIHREPFDQRRCAEIDARRLAGELVVAYDLPMQPEGCTEALAELVKHLPIPTPHKLALLHFNPEAGLRNSVEWIDKHGIKPRKPKGVRGRGRPKGSGLKETTTQEVKLWEEGLSDKQIYEKLRPSQEFDGGGRRRARIGLASEEEQARIKAAHQAGRARLKSEKAERARLKKNRNKNQN